MEKPENNIFLKENLIEANAQIAPEVYEHVALYSALYQTIFGSYIDYGFSDRAAVDKFITAKIKTMLTVIDKIFKDPKNKDKTFDDIMNNNFDPPPGLKSSDSHFLDENLAFQQLKDNNWIKNYLPLLKRSKTITVFNEETGLEEQKKIDVIDHQRYAGYQRG